jgi:hypothetical protein
MLDLEDLGRRTAGKKKKKGVTAKKHRSKLPSSLESSLGPQED